MHQSHAENLKKEEEKDEGQNKGSSHPEEFNTKWELSTELSTLCLTQEVCMRLGDVACKMKGEDR
jgi:hypothetical protein